MVPSARIWQAKLVGTANHGACGGRQSGEFTCVAVIVVKNNEPALPRKWAPAQFLWHMRISWCGQTPLPQQPRRNLDGAGVKPPSPPPVDDQSDICEDIEQSHTPTPGLLSESAVVVMCQVLMHRVYVNYTHMQPQRTGGF